MLKTVLLLLSLLVFKISAQNQTEIIKIDWDNIWQFEEVKPNKVKLSRLPLTRLNEIRKGRIIGGTEALPHRLPYQAALIMDFGAPIFCGASLIKPKFVLTAAHCTKGAKSVIVILGAHNITNESEPGQIRMKLSPYWVLSHHLFWPHTFKNDIALVQLPEPVQLNQYIQAVGLPNFADLYVGSECLISGWGLIRYGDKQLSDLLRYTSTKIISNNDCVKTYEFVKENYMCSSGATIKSTCSGDSGGPLVADVKGYPVQFGIASFKYSGGCELGKPSGFTRVAAFMPWILQHIS